MRRRKKLHADESNATDRLIRINALAIKVLENETYAKQWLNTPNISLGDVTPLSLLDTAVGSKQVEHLLGRIEYGVLS